MNLPVIKKVKRSPACYLKEMFMFIRNPLVAFTYQKETWGDIVPLALPGPKLILFCHPDHFSSILKLPLKDKITRSTEDLMGNGLLNNSGKDWQKHRRMISPAFSPKNLNSFIAKMQNISEQWTLSVTDAEEVDVSTAMLDITLDVILQTVFGGYVDIDKTVVAENMEEYMYQFFLDTGSWRTLFPKFITTPGRKKRKQAMYNMEDFVYKSIGDRRGLPADNDLLYTLISAKDDDGSSLSSKDLRDEILTLILAGHETTALMLTFSLFELAKSPEIQSQAREEVLNKLPSTEFNRDDLSKCTLINAILDEALRLYPPAYVVAREAQEDMTIGDYKVQLGDQLIVPAWVIHRDTRWWEAPDEFRPQRWLNGETKNIPKTCFFPFGGGPRLCVGMHFAKFEGAVVLIELLKKFEFTVAEDYDLELMQSITLRPKDGVKLRFNRLSDPNIVKNSRCEDEVFV